METEWILLVYSMISSLKMYQWKKKKLKKKDVPVAPTKGLN